MHVGVIQYDRQEVAEATPYHDVIYLHSVGSSVSGQFASERSDTVYEVIR